LPVDWPGECAEGICFDVVAFAVTASPALLLLWFREKAGSIVLPVLAHNVANGAFVLFQFLYVMQETDNELRFD